MIYFELQEQPVKYTKEGDFMMKKNSKNNKGITLVALVITIVILLILAGISIAQLTGNGLFENAKLAKEKYYNAQDLENSILDDYNDKINGITGTSRADNVFSGVELLAEPVIVTTSTTDKIINQEFTIEDSFENYEFLLFTIGIYNNQSNTFSGLETLMISTKQIKYLQNLYSSNNYIILDSQSGSFYSYADICVKDNTTFRIYDTQSANSARTHFGIISIQGIK